LLLGGRFAAAKGWELDKDMGRENCGKNLGKELRERGRRCREYNGREGTGLAPEENKSASPCCIPSLALVGITGVGTVAVGKGRQSLCI